MTSQTNIRLGCATLFAGLLLALCPRAGLAFDATTDHVCVANCGTSAPSGGSGSAPSAPAVNPAVGAAVGSISYGVGYAIGRALSGQNDRQNIPDSRQNAAASQYLDQWEKEGSPTPAAASYDLPADHGGLGVASARQPAPAGSGDDKSTNTMLRVINQTPSYVTVSVDGSYGCNTAGGTTCTIPVLKGSHTLLAVRTDTGARFSQSVEIPGSGLVWPLSGN